MEAEYERKIIDFSIDYNASSDLNPS
jgi:hypothetical protein